jgi:hypothetical protein
MNPLALVVTCVAGWMNRHQQVVIAYLQAEVRVLQEQLGRRPRFNDDQTARHLTDGLDGFLNGCRYLIQDRSPRFTKEFEALLQSAGVQSVR